MPFIQKALVAIDDSVEALHAFLQAITLQTRFGCDLFAVSVAPAYTGDLPLRGPKEVEASLGEPALTVLEEAVRIAVEEGVGLTTFTATGDRAEAILSVAVREGCDLLVMGRRTRHRALPWGSLTAKLLRQSPMDLLLVPKPCVLRFDRVLYLEDGQVLPPLGDPSLPAARESWPRTHRGSLRNLTRAAWEMQADLVVLRGDLPRGLTDTLTGGALFRTVCALLSPVWVRRDPGASPFSLDPA